ncbi:hypothetical protein F0Z19_0827 [Vibrio cyclitrophicus]|jgi:hypothetical protein|nr:hypothetical protein F0Z19_0827 [Vibrio cyclitrophicus]
MLFCSKNQRNIELRVQFSDGFETIKRKLVRNSAKKISIIKSDSDTITA